MVVQQGTRIPIWGHAEPSETVTVALAGRVASVAANQEGHWRVDLRALKAGGPHTMTVAGRESTVRVNDVLVGEVWVCSGQSNMEWPLKMAVNGEQEVANANYPQMRLFVVEKKVAAEPQEDCTGRWVACTAESAKDFSAVGYFFGRKLHGELRVPVGLIESAWGGTPAESWTSHESLTATGEFNPILDRWTQVLADWPRAKADYDAKLKHWEEDAAKAKAAGQEPPHKPWLPLGPEHPHRPTSLYNGMISPLLPYAIQGAIWYQGESNAGRAYQYRSLFPAMIQDWRRAWGGHDFFFYFVQLANFMTRLDQPQEESEWAELREAQLMTLKLKNTGMAVIIDIGEAEDIHPRNKQDVGLRLALAALAETYHRDLPHSGPNYKSMRVSGNRVTLRFTDTDAGLLARGGGPLKGFTIAGDDQKFVWANAEIRKNSVVVWSDAVAKPTAVRYAWADNPECNLYNGAGLPASPFRTDDWPGVTVDKR
ncbi:MAG: sialate O-acetylesterase [Candidatus Hydrogenedentes bacterium]|nr:sialate O-acetylesterase [Candidatus Hydrogenedentota bacterium]